MATTPTVALLHSHDQGRRRGLACQASVSALSPDLYGAEAELWTWRAPTPPSTPTSASPPRTTSPPSDSYYRNARSSNYALRGLSAESSSASSLSWRLRSRRQRLSTRPEKRLFTPDIKRLLKGWLVRRRDNPYPSRPEKETLAVRTGLTYMQVCNWFANWRRKLRDCGRLDDGDSQEGGVVELRGGGGGGSVDGRASGAGGGSWAHLIRRYHRQCKLAAPPNATTSATSQEHFSISSSDSIWGAQELPSDATCSGSEPHQNAHVSSTTTDVETRSDMTATRSSRTEQPSCQQNDKKVTDRDAVREVVRDTACEEGSALLLSKWLESAARYQPSRSRPATTTATTATASATTSATTTRAPGWGIASAAVEHTLEGRHREELDAAEALTFLSSLHFR